MLSEPHEMREKILFEPLSLGADTLRIISGYSAHTMASWHINEIHERFGTEPEIELTVGMCMRDMLFRPVHEGFKAVMNERADFVCRYITGGVPVHTKLYLWKKDGKPFRAFTGSANYTQPAFFGRNREAMAECDPDEADYYLDSLEADSMPCTHPDIEKHIIITDRPKKIIRPGTEHEKLSSRSVQSLDVESVSIRLVDRKGKVPERSGLNWGQREGRDRSQAYLSVPADIARSDFFPERGIYFTALTDDNTSLTLNRGQDNGKGITTPLNNAELGRYLRKRLGVHDGAFVTRKNLDAYGRTDITFYKLDDEQYFMDFSKPEGD